MRLDMIRIKAAQISIGDVLCFPNPSMDFEVVCIYRRDDGRLVFNEAAGWPVEPSAYVFRKVA
jgi:hypothetical protein